MYIGKNTFCPLLVGLACVGLAACGHNDDNNDVPAPVEVSYRVTVTNLTSGQALSPIAFLAHSAGKLWEVGHSASESVALMAESGDNSEMLNADGVIMGVSGEMPLAPGESVELILSLEPQPSLMLSVAGMLVNTNDGFTGVTGLEATVLAIGESHEFYTRAYDAGTEANTELKGTIPGPADGGEGVSEGREAHDTVAMHPGVVTRQDGLAESVLQAEHKFDNPVAKISLQRLE
ncbi:hypothetical protein DXV75_03795 [Alteromonas aestuariivivens]|uniref:Spondin domain-containing protein n=1 Tax=Alteromonas aestuariivivens TaxID=1938339 RepID=A0A3D8ME07_9ALTE|nr:spondin domain-containing protein [Alteromonas aestuariivivens]RDV28097.1 hypothetical protein DXV75_03795 [Alteromonas aestuariivivens]